MDPTRFDALTRALSQVLRRRDAVALLTALPLAGAVAGVEEAGAEKPHERLRRKKAQRRRKQRNRRRRNQHQNQNPGNGGGNNAHGGLGGDRCVTNGKACQRNSDCCNGNCFGQVCAAAPTQCGNEVCPAGSNGCCGGLCCQAPANQCNALAQCCAPNCSDRECGADGCGGSGTCGTCLPGQTCNGTGQCQGTPTCGPETCDGCCDAGGTCRTGTSPQACGTGGVACAVCATGLICNSVTNVCSPDCDVCPTCAYTTIQAAVADPNGPGTIRLCAGTYSGDIDITRSLTLIGAGDGDGPGDTILQGTGLQTVVTIEPTTPGPVTLQGLRITNGNSPGDSSNGGGVTHSGPMLTMTDCTVIRNTATQAGGGIFAEGPGSMSLTGCTITENEVAVLDATASALGGGLFIQLDGSATLTNCVVSLNSGDAVNGVVGGGIFLDSGSLTLDDTTVTQNTAESVNGSLAGGGIFNAFGTVTLQNGASVVDNVPDDCVDRNGPFTCSASG